ncbi:hypothetical protein [Micromonospora cathayae]|uniref:Uncharacterized protein n=1 Tax=Micromonospora cathayae TaxID=3028804 RepID=A0ABY7ZM02_9ACTN|nr:hypothetical protein [Micromonospora sp. HUAS 3]WDZ84004.1 hypothetical protein PVK37_26610 [Micromonospora sp. HUAS 3]
MHNPRRQLAKLLTLYAALPLVCAAAAAYIAVTLANATMDRRIDALEQDQAQRRSAAAAEARARDARLGLEQTRRDLCVALDRLAPRDRPVQELRWRYRCTAPEPAPSPTATPTPDAGRTAPGRPGASRPMPVPGPTRPAGPTGPPGSPGSPAPTPTPRPSPVLICVPLLDLCV